MFSLGPGMEGLPAWNGVFSSVNFFFGDGLNNKKKSFYFNDVDAV